MKMPLRLSATLLLLLTLALAACGQAQTGSTTTEATAATGGEATAATVAEPTTATLAEPTAATEGGATGNGATISVGSKNFTEVLIVGEMQALMLEEAGFTVERKLNLGATPVAQTALVNGDIDIYGEYTSTGLQEVLKDTKRYPNADAIFEAVSNGYEQQFQLNWLEPSPFNNTNAFATTKAIADQYGLKTYSDLAAKASELRLGGPPEFPDREDTKGLYEAYGDFAWKEYKQLDTGSLRYDALKSGEIDVVVAFGTDGRIAGDQLVLLEDDKSYYPVYQLAPVVRADVLQANPGIAEALNKLAPLLTDEVMAGLNYQVDGPDQQDPTDVARSFLQEKGLIK